MNIRSALASLFIAGGVFFFTLAAVNLWGSRSGVPLNEATSTPNSQVDLQSLTARPLVGDSTLNLRGVDVLSLVILPANYGCGACSQRARAFVQALTTHSSFESLSMTASAVIAEPDHRVATHFARVQQLETPVFQASTVPLKRWNKKVGLCSVLLIDPKTETAFFQVHLTRARVTGESDAIFEAAREAYSQRDDHKAVR